MTGFLPSMISIINSEHELKQPSNDSRLGQLKKELSFAIDEEDYEEAAKIRDIIKDMEDN